MEAQVFTYRSNMMMLYEEGILKIPENMYVHISAVYSSAAKLTKIISINS
jgi:hypothetical protein